MKKTISILAVTSLLFASSCQKSDFADAYKDPAKISQSIVEKQFAGYLNTTMQPVLPSYWNYFVILRTTLQYYNQAVGFVNSSGQYVPGSAAISDRWGNFYGSLAQYRELEKIYAQLSADDQKNYRVFMLAAKIYFYDHVQKIVDLHGDVPFSKAGMLSTNSGDYMGSFAPYDPADKIYTTMLDELKSIADELATINVNPGILVGFRNQDIVNKGDVMKWRKYCNSLRIRMLVRVGEATAFSARAAAEITAIASNPTTYPVIAANTDNVEVKVLDLNTPLNSNGFRTGLEDWNGNVASKPMIEHMKANTDPRLRVVFEPGLKANGVYEGVDPLGDPAVENQKIADGLIAMYNRTTLSRNQYFPGVLMNAAEVSFLVAEALVRSGNAAAAKTAYEKGIAESVNMYYTLRTLSRDATSPAIASLNPAEITDYLAQPAVAWDNATTSAQRLGLIMTQKWLHMNVVQPVELWSEVRRLDPPLTFWTDASVAQTKPPVRWVYPGSEQIYNKANYAAVSSKDNLTTRLFWDVR
jgi:hypothetical protein